MLDYEADAYLVADQSGGLHLVDAGADGVSRSQLDTVDTTRPSIGGVAMDEEWLGQVMRNHRYDRRVMGQLDSVVKYLSTLVQNRLRGYRTV